MRIAGYLNATPRQGAESLRNWTEFRVAHNGEEGDREVRLLAGATGHLSFRSATGSCVLDSYRTESGHPLPRDGLHRLRAVGDDGESSAPRLRASWAAEAPTIKQAINSFTT